MMAISNILDSFSRDSDCRIKLLHGTLGEEIVKLHEITKGSQIKILSIEQLFTNV